MSTRSHLHDTPAGRPVQRELFQTILDTALQRRENRFARDVALSWLASFPGDLPVNRIYAELLLEEGHPDQALPLLHSICQADPEYLEAVEAKLLAEERLKGRKMEKGGRLTKLYRELAIHTTVDTRGWAAALSTVSTGQGRDHRENIVRDNTVAAWSRHLSEARQAIAKGAFRQAEDYLNRALADDPSTPLVAAVHMRLLLANQETPPEARLSLAEHYHQRWPECVHVMLVLADALMDCGDDERGVALLHRAVSADITGQVAERLWGPANPYRSMWPAPLSIRMETPVPAGVAAALGWNQLPIGYTNTPSQNAVLGSTSAPLPSQDAPSQLFDRTTSSPGVNPNETRSPENTLATAMSIQQPDADPSLASSPHSTQVDPVIPETLRSVQSELEKIALRLNRSGLARADGRFPVYVILTSRAGLEKTYGQDAQADLEANMLRLARTVRACQRWDAVVFYADEGRAITGGSRTVSVTPARPNDPWSIKLALADLDAALVKHGEMIGAVLIVGGPEVVPFHHLPNPVDDNDLDVPSDNPYGTRDENYFIPEWPVGRLPGGTPQQKDNSSYGAPEFLTCTLINLAVQHENTARLYPRRRRLLRRWFTWLRTRSPRRRKARPSLGYTAAIWKRASLTVFRPIGESRAMLVSPPVQVGAEDILAGGTVGSPNTTKGSSSAKNGKKRREMPLLPIARLGYFNLHGLEDAVEWYGQRDPTEPGEGPDYPIALRPEDIPNSGSAPQVVFSEACYGAHIMDRRVEEALSLKFLQSGAQAVVGCTSTSYGSIQTPLIAADFLGHSFWNYLQGGLPAGEALRRAKMTLAREMHNRQGYLDGEDQKTLISFVLYGDPLAQPVSTGKIPKGVIRPLNPQSKVKTVCDRTSEAEAGQPLPADMLIYVKKIVEKYLPGMEDANLTWCHEHEECHENGHQCPTGQLTKASRISQKLGDASRRPGRSVIILSKQKRVSNGATPRLHRRYARLTLDEKGKLVKLVVSR